MKNSDFEDVGFLATSDTIKIMEDKAKEVAKTCDMDTGHCESCSG